jgi:hypothetical protein
MSVTYKLEKSGDPWVRKLVWIAVFSKNVNNWQLGKSGDPWVRKSVWIAVFFKNVSHWQLEKNGDPWVRKSVWIAVFFKNVSHWQLEKSGGPWVRKGSPICCEEGPQRKSNPLQSADTNVIQNKFCQARTITYIFSAPQCPKHCKSVSWIISARQEQ